MHDRSGRVGYPPQAADVAGTPSVAMRGAGGLRAARIARSERGVEQRTSSCARLRQRAEALSASTDALRGFPNDPGSMPDRRRPESVVSGAGVPRSLHTASLWRRDALCA